MKNAQHPRHDTSPANTTTTTHSSELEDSRRWPTLPKRGKRHSQKRTVMKSSSACHLPSMGHFPKLGVLDPVPNGPVFDKKQHRRGAQSSGRSCSQTVYSYWFSTHTFKNHSQDTGIAQR